MIISLDGKDMAVVAVVSDDEETIGFPRRAQRLSKAQQVTLRTLYDVQPMSIYTDVWTPGMRRLSYLAYRRLVRENPINKNALVPWRGRVLGIDHTGMLHIGG